MEPKCQQLAKLMADSVYPRLLELITHIGYDKLRLKIGSGFCGVVFFQTGVFQKMNTDDTVRYTFKSFQEINICPIFGTYTNPDDYLNYCNVVMDKLPNLERELFRVEKVLERATTIGVTYERKVIIEKK